MQLLMYLSQKYVVFFSNKNALKHWLSTHKFLHTHTVTSLNFKWTSTTIRGDKSMDSTVYTTVHGGLFEFLVVFFTWKNTLLHFHFTYRIWFCFFADFCLFNSSKYPPNVSHFFTFIFTFVYVNRIENRQVCWLDF